MQRRRRGAAIGLALCAIALGASAGAADKKAADPVRERGRYLTIIGGCNDCHTPGYAMSGGKVDECTFHLGFYVPEPAMSPSAHEHWRRNMDLVLATVKDEDIPTSRGIQTGATSGAQTHVVFGRNEPALIGFHRALRDAMA